MENIYKSLLNLGFIIYEDKNEFFLQKVSLPHSPKMISKISFATYDEALNFAKSVVDIEKKTNYKALIRYRQGLGVEYVTVPSIVAKDEKEAEIIASEKSGLRRNSSSVNVFKKAMTNRCSSALRLMPPTNPASTLFAFAIGLR